MSVLRRRARGLTTTQHDADDLVQETMVGALRGMDAFDGRHSRAWLLTIMRNAWINGNRKLRPVPVLDPELVSMHRRPETSVWNTPEDALDAKTLDPRLQAALDDLPVHQRVVVDTVVFRGLSCRDAADSLEIPVGTVLSRLHRARSALRADSGVSQLAPSHTSTAPDRDGTTAVLTSTTGGAA